MKSRASCGCEVDSITDTFPCTMNDTEYDYVSEKFVPVYVSGSYCFDCILFHYFSGDLADICATRKTIDNIKHKAEKYKSFELDEEE